MGSTCYGVLMWRLKPVVLQEKSGATMKFLVFLTQGTDESALESVQEVLEFVTISDLKWRCAEATIAPSQELKMKNFAEYDGSLNGPLFFPTTFRDLLDFSAVRAFQGLSAPLLNKLAGVIGLRFARGGVPRCLASWIRALVKHVLPSLNDDEVEHIVHLRAGGGEESDSDEDVDLMGGLLDASGRSMLKGVIDDDDLDALTTLKKKRYDRAVAAKVAEKRSAEKARVAAATARGKPKAAATAPGSSASSSRAPLSGLPVPPSYTASAFRQFLPQVAGCNLYLEQKWHTRWRVTYPSAAPPWACSRSFVASNATTIRAALVEVIKWCWERHVADGGEPCPWQLDGEVGDV